MERRLDERGVHAVSAPRPDTMATWCGEVRHYEHHEECDAIELHMPSDLEKKIMVKVGDFVYLRGRRIGAPAEIARVEYLARSKDPKDPAIAFDCTWLWREEDLTFEPPSDVEIHTRELFISTTKESREQFIVAIEMELPTIYPVEYLDEVPSGVLEKPNTWFYRRTVNLQTATLSALKVRAPAHTPPTLERRRPSSQFPPGC